MTDGFLIQRKSITIPGGQEIACRGLSTPDIAWLAQNCGPALIAAFAKVRDSGMEVTAEELYGMLAGDLAIEGPLLAAHIIAAGADMHNHVDSAGRLPFSTQIELLTCIGELTFAQEGGAKKVLETVIRVAVQVRGISAPTPAPQT